MSIDEQIEMALKLIDACFLGVTDKGGVPYAMHPRRVADRIEDKTAKVVALLHDVIEDTEITREDLINMGFSEEIVSAVEVITIKSGEAYNDYINRVIASNNILSLTVKKADMEDNQNEERLSKLPESERIRLTNKYKDNYVKVVSALERTKGDK